MAEAAIRVDLAEDLTARTLSCCEPLLPRADVPEHILRTSTSREVLAVEADLVTRIVGRAEQPAHVAAFADPDGEPQPDQGPEGLDLAQRAAVALLAGSAQLLVVEGAAGAGKTKTLFATQELLAERGHRMVVVTPTLKAAKVAGRKTGTKAFSAAWLAHQHGWRWDDDGRWTRGPSYPVADAVLQCGDLLLVDEAGMLDQDTALALLTLADETKARVALVGDRHQLPAVGRGGLLDLAARWARPEPVVSLDVVHRFTDPQYADLSLAMRTGVRAGEVFDALVARDQVRLYPTGAERTQTLADLVGDNIRPGKSDVLVMADTREQVAALNGAIRDRLVAAGYVDDGLEFVTDAGERLGVGDRVLTRRNDRDLAVANRDTWTITGIDHDRTLTLHNANAHNGSRSLPPAYAHEHVELAYATTVHGAQGETTHTGHLLLGEHTHAAAAYVAMTRGREDNVATWSPRTSTMPGTSGSRPSAANAPTSAPGAPPDVQPRTSKGTPHTVPSSPPWPTYAPRGRPNKTYTTPCAARAATTPWRSTANLPQPGSSPTAPTRTGFVTSSPPPPPRCAPASRNPPSDPCHQVASSENTTTGSRTAATSSKKPRPPRSASPGPSARPATKAPTAHPAHPTEAEASADNPTVTDLPPRRRRVVRHLVRRVDRSTANS